MRIIRYQYNNTIQYGKYENQYVYPLMGDLFDSYSFSDEAVLFEDVHLLAPILPNNLYAIGLNYFDHVGELDFARTLPTEPISFLVSTDAVIGPNDTIILDDPQCCIDEEAELTVIIGKTCKNVPEESALDYVFGYTCGNDVSNRDRQRQDGQWLRGKSYPTYKPLGPWIETDLDPTNLVIQGKRNNVIVQNSNTKHLLFSVANIISFLSTFTTLRPGDAIMTGTPQGVTALQHGDTVEVYIEGIGSLKNKVINP